MKLKHYIVTYNNPIWQTCVRTILATPAGEHVREIYILNNHTNFFMPDDLAEHVKVIHNQGRADFSTGHLSRSWNQGLIHGFVNLKNPDADLVVLSQNDAEFTPNYIDQLLALHSRFDIVTHGQGDNCVSYTAQGVRRVGLWDERFPNIAHQEGDYFLRVMRFLGDRGSVNDPQHGRFHNPAPSITRGLPTGHARREASHLASTPWHPLAERVFLEKWGGMTSPMFWHAGNNPHNAFIKILGFIHYPYFEHDVETLKEQNYVFLEHIGDPEPADRKY